MYPSQCLNDCAIMTCVTWLMKAAESLFCSSKRTASDWNHSCHGNAGDPDEWEEKMMTVDLLVPMRLTRRLAPEISKRQDGGYIINISSVAGLEALPGIGGYNAAKFGFTGWAKSTYQVRAPLAETSTTVQGICTLLQVVQGY